MKSTMKNFILVLIFYILSACNTSSEGKNMLDTTQFFKTKPDLLMANAIEAGDLLQINELAKILNINKEHERGMTFLMWSIAQQKLTATEALLELGSKPNRPVEGSFPLSIAAKYDDINLLKLLIKYNANINQKIKGSPVWFETIYTHNWEHLDFFLNKGADINAQNRVGESAIRILAGLKQYKKVLELINRGADITAGLNTLTSFAYSVEVDVPEKKSEINYRLQVIRMLEHKGIFFPVKSPKDIREEKKNQKQ